MVEGKKRTIFAVLNHEAGRGPARLRRLVWDQEIAGSNPAAPTTKAAHTVSGFFVRESEIDRLELPLRALNARQNVLPNRKIFRETKPFSSPAVTKARNNVSWLSTSHSLRKGFG